MDLKSDPASPGNFILGLERPQMEPVCIQGKDQHLTLATPSPEGLLLQWKGPLQSSTGENLTLMSR